MLLRALRELDSVLGPLAGRVTPGLDALEAKLSSAGLTLEGAVRSADAAMGWFPGALDRHSNEVVRALSAALDGPVRVQLGNVDSVNRKLVDAIDVRADQLRTRSRDVANEAASAGIVNLEAVLREWQESALRGTLESCQALHESALKGGAEALKELAGASFQPMLKELDSSRQLSDLQSSLSESLTELGSRLLALKAGTALLQDVAGFTSIPGLDSVRPLLESMGKQASTALEELESAVSRGKSAVEGAAKSLEESVEWFPRALGRHSNDIVGAMTATLDGSVRGPLGRLEAVDQGLTDALGTGAAQFVASSRDAAAGAVRAGTEGLEMAWLDWQEAVQHDVREAHFSLQEIAMRRGDELLRELGGDSLQPLLNELDLSRQLSGLQTRVTEALAELGSRLLAIRAGAGVLRGVTGLTSIPGLEAVKSLLESLESDVQAALGSLDHRVSECQDAVLEAVDVIESTLDWAPDALDGFSEQLADRLDEVFADALEDASAELDSTDDLIVDLAVDELDQLVSDLAQSLEGLGEKALSQIVDDLVGLYADLRGELRVASQALQEALLKGAEDGVSEALTQVQESVLERVRDELVSCAELTMLQSTLSSALAPYTPQLAAIKAASAALRHAIEVYRMGL